MYLGLRSMQKQLEKQMLSAKSQVGYILSLSFKFWPLISVDVLKQNVRDDKLN